MKTLVFIFSMMTFLTLNSFGQDKKIANLLKNPENRIEIFNNILNNHEFMMEFMQSMQGNKHAMTMMQSNNEMMENKGGMGMNKDNKMKENPEMMQKMLGNMMDKCKQDSAACNKMTDMMTNHPEMMEMCIKKMKEKGMMDPDGKMKMMNSEGKSTGKEHNHQH